MYTVESVTALLPGVWDESIALNDANPYAPDPEMPTATKDPRRLNDKWVMVADVQVAWRKAPLTLHERQALFCTCLLLESDPDTAHIMGTTYGSVVEHREKGLLKLVAYLNGEWFDVPVGYV